jgi:hypothetical protein
MTHEWEPWRNPLLVWQEAARRAQRQCRHAPQTPERTTCAQQWPHDLTHWCDGCFFRLLVQTGNP